MRRLTRMFVAIVQIPMTKRSRDEAVASATKTAPTYTALKAKGLIRKYYLNGETGGGGVYLWESEAAARAWYTPEWEKRVEAAFGGKPTVTYYDNHVVVDNEAGKVNVSS
jgi:heme-degrading monooxygenase HmoA